MLNQYIATLKSKTELAHNAHQFVFTIKNDTLIFQPGQYILLEIPLNGEKKPHGFRQYSIASSPTNTSEFELLVDVTPMGLGSKFLLNLEVGDTIRFRAPLGVFVLQNTPLPKVFLATGSGIAPMKSMLEYMQEQNMPHIRYLFWGMRKTEHVYYKDIWGTLAQQKQFDYTLCLSQNRPADHCIQGYIQDALTSLFTHYTPNTFEYYLCARPSIVEDVISFLAKKEIPIQNIHHEKFT